MSDTLPSHRQAATDATHDADAAHQTGASVRVHWGDAGQAAALEAHAVAPGHSTGAWCGQDVASAMESARAARGTHMPHTTTRPLSAPQLVLLPTTLSPSTNPAAAAADCARWYATTAAHAAADGVHVASGHTNGADGGQATGSGAVSPLSALASAGIAVDRFAAAAANSHDMFSGAVAAAAAAAAVTACSHAAAAGPVRALRSASSVG